MTALAKFGLLSQIGCFAEFYSTAVRQCPDSRSAKVNGSFLILGRHQIIESAQFSQKAETTPL
jgi:hypothetical protein